MPGCFGFSCRGVLIAVALLSGFAAAARANILHDIDDFFSGNAPEVATSQACRNYAFSAMKDVARAQSLKCPLTGGRYSTDESGHYQWCMGVEPETSRHENASRDHQVTVCATYQIEADFYADVAAKAARDNKLYNCGFTGPRWGEGYEGHRAYFLSEKITQRDRNEWTNWPMPEHDTRLTMIAQCKGKYSEKKKQFCNSVAIQAADAAKFLKENGCAEWRLAKKQFDTNYDAHFSWCLGPGPTEARNNDLQIRRDAVKSCGARANLYQSAPKRDLSDFSKGAPNPPAKPAPKGNSGPGTGGTYMSKPVDGNSAMDRLGGGGGGGSAGGGGGINTSRPGAPAPRVGSSGAPASKPVTPTYGGGINTSKPAAPTYGGGVNLSR